MQNEDGFLKNQLLTFKKIVAGGGGGRKKRKNERERAWQLEHIFQLPGLLSRFFLFWGNTSPFRVPFGTVPWTPCHRSVDNGQCLHSRACKKEKGACQTQPHAHLSLLFPASGLPLERRFWCLLGTVKIWSPSQLFLNRPHSFQTLKGTKWKKTPSSHQACAATCS